MELGLGLRSDRQPQAGPERRRELEPMHRRRMETTNLESPWGRGWDQLLLLLLCLQQRMTRREMHPLPRALQM